MTKSFPTLLLLVLLSTSAFSQKKGDPVAAEPGFNSLTTDREIYTYSRVYEIDMLLLENTNEFSEQSLFYEGKYDPWKNKVNKSNMIYFQPYYMPPHTIPLYKKIFMDATEVANIHYQEFLHFVERDSGQDIHDFYVPKLDEKYMNDYYLNPEFYFYPVVGINPDQARTYCDWRAKKP